MTSRRSFIQAASMGRSSKLNVLILITDDQRADTIAAWGNSNILTPNLDKLVRRGVSFRNCYNQGGTQGAVCIASRAMLLSGKSLWRATSPKGLDGPLLPERFAEAGYRSFISGKWHNGAALLNRSFQAGGLIHLGGMGPQINPKLQKFGDARDIERVGRATPLIAESLKGFLRESSRSQEPFFAYCAFTAPHDPREAAGADLKLYQSRELPLPRPWFPAPPLDNGEIDIRDENVVPAPRTQQQCQSELASYYALITELDRHIGEILATLETTGQLSNTIIVFAGDNGLALGAHGLMGKQSMYEHSLRVPLIMAGPGIQARTELQPMYLYEVYGRLCQQLKLATPTGVEKPGAPLYFGYRDFQRSVRIGERKMSWSKQLREQYDLASDPYEERNLWGSSKAWAESEFLAAQELAKAHFSDPVSHNN